MAKIAKSKDQANYRKGANVQVGDVISVINAQWQDEFAPVVAIQRAESNYDGRGAGRRYVFVTDVTPRDGYSHTSAAGSEFVRGQYAV
jgi:hypothetical protein